ncbi:protein kinase [Streptomyces sp. NPDC059256]|uniref:protein kinase domain-containing protein n=1 Tax=Streptomyces sp. NPDC059256 TaxID=3346794 RepID=UPI0036B95855
METIANRYDVKGILGRGGMGVVYAAVDRELGRDVAVKVLPTEFLREPDFRTRFHREARTVARLNHPGVAMLHDIGEDSTQDPPMPYLVMELVRGRTLAEIAAGRRLTVEQAVGITLEILEALEHSHAEGVVHRDIKPSNVMVVGPLAGGSGSRDRAKVLDFGIAKLLADTSTRLTATGVSVGTPSYLSPEQAEGNGTDGRSDLYSVGCLLYELLTGRPPFNGDSPFVVLLAHIQKPPTPPIDLRPDLPIGVNAVVLAALAKKPEDRFVNATAMHTALSDALVQPASAPVPPSDRARALTHPATVVDHARSTTPAVTVDVAPTTPAEAVSVPPAHPRRPMASPASNTVTPSPDTATESAAVTPSEVRPASLGQRFRARAIDAAFLPPVFALHVSLVYGLMDDVGAGGTVGAVQLTFATAFLYEFLAVMIFGTTVGKRTVGLRVIDRTTHAKPGWGALSRAFVFWALLAGWGWLTMVLLIDLLFLARNRSRHRFLHERASRSLVVHA